MSVMPEPTPTAPAAGQTTNPLSDAVIQAAVDNAIHESRRESTSPPAPRREVSAMSAHTTEIARTVMFCSLATVPPGLVAVAVMVASEHANPTVIGMICAAPAAVAVPILAVARLIRRVGQATPAEIHQHISGPVRVDQRNVQNKNTGVWVKNTNEQ
jgi:hypothetical protein